ncbi:MAG TPA: chemotaxis protein CheX [Nocardioidaceae bacterium]|nr:chemotaxis protein CheX [Nocardioidaceae bacterium]
MTVEAPELWDVLSIAGEVWTSFIGPDEPLVPAGEEAFPVAWSGAVSVTGDWSGMVVVEMPEHCAVAATSRMLMIDEPSQADVSDAVGELVNMVGGNVKCLLFGENSLSLPVVALGRVTPPGDAVEVCRADLQWSEGPLRITVHSVAQSGVTS